MTLETFTAAFRAIRAASATRSNLVPLSDLRAAFPSLSRAAFDAALYELRKTQAVVLETSESRHGKPSPDRMAGALEEGGRCFVYACLSED